MIKISYAEVCEEDGEGGGNSKKLEQASDCTVGLTPMTQRDTKGRTGYFLEFYWDVPTKKLHTGEILRWAEIAQVICSTLLWVSHWLGVAWKKYHLMGILGCPKMYVFMAITVNLKNLHQFCKLLILFQIDYFL